jgi:glycosyltransferase involved in cell wall biosynthesis
VGKISAVSFIYNEAENIKECLASLAPHVDQILLVDMDSTDGTLELAYEYTKDIYRKPHLVCGDQYKEFLTYHSKHDWLLWFYPDERFGEKSLAELRALTEKPQFDAYAFMRHEYRDGIRLMPHGTNESPNYQNRLHRKGRGIFYTELVHAELHGRFNPCYLPEEYFMEHRKTDVGQEFDNYRTYVEMKHLLWKYRDTKCQPYRDFCDSYRRIISESEAKNDDGSRNVHPAEELWWEWWIHKDKSRVPIGEFTDWKDSH